MSWVLGFKILYGKSDYVYFKFVLLSDLMDFQSSVVAHLNPKKTIQFLIYEVENLKKDNIDKSGVRKIE